MASDRRLDEARWASMERIAGRVAAHGWGDTGPDWGMNNRRDAALDGLVEYVAEHGWPDEDGFDVLFKAAHNAVRRAYREQSKHRTFGAYWTGTSGSDDPIGERVTERLGVYQLTYAFTETEWLVVWSLARSIALGEDQNHAAAYVGMNAPAFKQRLYRARQRARSLWCAPGEHISAYHPYRETGRSVVHDGIYHHRQCGTCVRIRDMTDVFGAW